MARCLLITLEDIARKSNLVLEHYTPREGEMVLREIEEQASAALTTIPKSVTNDKVQRALALWKRWFEESPWSNGGNYPWLPYRGGQGYQICFFCDAEKDRSHEPDCIYLAAKELVAEDADGNPLPQAVGGQ